MVETVQLESNCGIFAERTHCATRCLDGGCFFARVLFSFAHVQFDEASGEGEAPPQSYFLGNSADCNGLNLHTSFLDYFMHSLEGELFFPKDQITGASTNDRIPVLTTQTQQTLLGSTEDFAATDLGGSP
jgi:hypothetical protein